MILVKFLCFVDAFQEKPVEPIGVVAPHSNKLFVLHEPQHFQSNWLPFLSNKWESRTPTQVKGPVDVELLHVKKIRRLVEVFQVVEIVQEVLLGEIAFENQVGDVPETGQ